MEKGKDQFCCDAKYELEKYKKIIEHAKQLFMDENYEGAFIVLCRANRTETKSKHEERLKTEPY